MLLISPALGAQRPQPSRPINAPKPTRSADAVESMRGRFRGIYTLHWEGSRFEFCDEIPSIAREVFARDHQSQWISIVLATAAARRRFERVDVLPAARGETPLFVEWRGTLKGPGHYGSFAPSSFQIAVTHVDSIRAVQLGDCPRINFYARRAPVRFDTSAVLLAAWRALEATPAEGGRVRVLSVTSRFDLNTVPLSPSVTARLREGGVVITRPIEHFGDAQRETYRVEDLEPQPDGAVVAVLTSAFTVPSGDFEMFGSFTERVRVMCDASGCRATKLAR
ncbi:MAG: hypothetical protein IT353_04725 [Gemmatimonadaceae bacterium]|nr:hypothetical protein [Gemmatimonadaceae bacterium]